MGLRDLVIPTELVKVSDTVSLPVRGLSPTDFMDLYSRHTGEVSGLFEQFVMRAQMQKAIDSAEVLVLGLKAAPTIMAEVICLASGSSPEDGDNWHMDVRKAKTLTAAVQLDALKKISELTFTSDMPPKKFLAIVRDLAASATAVIRPQPALENGSGESAAK